MFLGQYRVLHFIFKTAGFQNVVHRLVVMGYICYIYVLYVIYKWSMSCVVEVLLLDAYLIKRRKQVQGYRGMSLLLGPPMKTFREEA